MAVLITSSQTLVSIILYFQRDYNSDNCIFEDNKCDERYACRKADKEAPEISLNLEKR